MSAHDLWQHGQKIVVQSLKRACEGNLPLPASLSDFSRLKQELRLLLLRVQGDVEGLDMDNFRPWRAPNKAIGCSWDLESLCRAIVEVKVRKLDWQSIPEWKREWDIFFRRVDELLQRKGAIESISHSDWVKIQRVKDFILGRKRIGEYCDDPDRKDIRREIRIHGVRPTYNYYVLRTNLKVWIKASELYRYETK